MASYRAPSYGMFTTTLETQYWFGVPRNVSFAGLSMDMDYLSRQAVDKQNDAQNWVNYNKSTGARYSAMEHLVPEQMFSTDTAPAEGVSAVKAIALASAEGQRIYTITADNVESALAAINIGPDTETEIRNAAYAGKEITTHQYQINFNGWIGEGYIIIDPETGAGAYKIAGGGNGSYYTLLAVAAAQIFGLSAIVNILAVVGPLFGLGGLVTAVLSPYLLLALAAVVFIAGVLAAFAGPNYDSPATDFVQDIANVALIFTLLAILLGGIAFIIGVLFMAIMISRFLILQLY